MASLIVFGVLFVVLGLEGVLAILLLVVCLLF